MAAFVGCRVWERNDRHRTPQLTVFRNQGQTFRLCLTGKENQIDRAIRSTAATRAPPSRANSPSIGIERNALEKLIELAAYFDFENCKSSILRQSGCVESVCHQGTICGPRPTDFLQR